MKIELLCFTSFLFLGFLNQPSVLDNPDSMQYNSTTFASIQSNDIVNPRKSDVDDTFKVLVKIKALLPIGWGTKYKCKILEIKEGILSGTDSSFLMSAATGSEKIYKDILLLKANENYLIEFVKSKQKTEANFVPVGTTGFLDKAGVIWNIAKVDKAN